MNQPSGGPLVRPHQIAALLELVGPGDIRALLDQAASDISQRLATISSGCAAGDAMCVAQAAHAITGIAANIGAERLQVLGKSLERCARAGWSDEIVRLVPAFNGVAADG